MSLYDIPVTTIDGKAITLDAYRGRALLIVNVASRCGFTPQYKGLEALHRRHIDHLAVLGFPCNQFGRQEPGTESQIREFCSEYYGVTFPLFAKIDVNGPGAHPLYRLLKSEKKGFLGREAIAWPADQGVGSVIAVLWSTFDQKLVLAAVNPLEAPVSFAIDLTSVADDNARRLTAKLVAEEQSTQTPPVIHDGRLMIHCMQKSFQLIDLIPGE